ncbi:MAG TPA: Asp-tRNA(Asn)/Glu-tRNA(Gln) amidotransferase subunit GatB [Gemmatimonadales bacterium]
MRRETVIGLEVHVQLATRSKMFCACSTAFGAPPNTQVCPVCLGLPGALPVPNAMAVRLGVRAALALGCAVHPRSEFARKNYFYPDLPKGYQITQFDRPLATGGRLALETADRGTAEVGIARLHLEEDAGKLLHDRIPGKTAVDLNRAGVPLAEIVTAPDLRSPAEARAWLTALRQLLIYAGVSDCSMEQGSLRVDANVSLRAVGDPAFGTRTEIKNLNSFANVERALRAETDRQQALLEAGRPVEHASLLFDAAAGAVRQMRSKEESHDYRYFPDPDLPPLVVSSVERREIEAELPELPAPKRLRLSSAYGLSAYEADVLAAERPVADFFEAVVAEGADPKSAAGWVMGLGLAGYHELGAFPDPSWLAQLITLVAEGALSLQAARRVSAEPGDGGEPPRSIAMRLGLLQVRDDDALGRWADEVIAAHPGEVARYRKGETRLLGFLVGQIMKRSLGAADPKRVQPLLKQKLEER